MMMQFEEGHIVKKTVIEEMVLCPAAPEEEPEPEFGERNEFSLAELEFKLILKSLTILRRRGTGDSAWSTSLEEEPLTFLLDAVSDAWIVRTIKGEVLFANQAAKALALESREFSRFESFTAKDARYEKRGISYAGITLEVAARKS